MSRIGRGMGRNRCALMMAVIVGAVGVSELEAQQRAAGPRGGPGMGPGVEAIMSMRDRLELTDAQVAALDELRAQQVAERNANRAAMEEMRSRLRAGEIDRQEMRTFMEEMRDRRPAADQRRAQLEAILDENQLQALDELRSRRPRMGRGGPAMRPGAMERGPRAMGRVGAMMQRRGQMMERRGEMLGRRGARMERRGEMLERRGEMWERRGRFLERRRRMMEEARPPGGPSTGSP